MVRCPITYQEINSGKYSKEGLKLFHSGLKNLSDLPFTAAELRQEAISRASKLSIQGVQPKLSAKLNFKTENLEIVDQGGQYIIKPQNDWYPELPENEDLTMRLAHLAGIEVPFHGLVYAKDGSLNYIIKRFDRTSTGKLHVEDFAQLSGNLRDTKYNFSMEKLAELVSQYCTFPALEKLKLFRLTIFNFLVGNEDMHLKNFSVIQKEGKIMLSPAYDLLNSTIVLKPEAEEIALTLADKKKKLNSNLIFDYYGRQRLGLTEKSIEDVVKKIRQAQTHWLRLVEESFLSDNMKKKYLDLLNERLKRLNI